MKQNFENQGIINLIKRINENPDLMDKFISIENPNINKMYQTALSIADGYTIEQFSEFLKELNNISKSLSENELSNVSGGANTDLTPEQLKQNIDQTSDIKYQLAIMFQKWAKTLSELAKKLHYISSMYN